jgi:hypothetical protein
MVNEPHFEKFEHLKFTIKENDSKGIIRREMDMIDRSPRIILLTYKRKHGK